MSTTANTSSASSPEATGLEGKGVSEASTNSSVTTTTVPSTTAATSEIESTFLMSKLRCLREIREKTLQLERMRSQLRTEVDITENEEKCLAEYKKEMESLLSEKMAHVEELRQIHADINAMEIVIKQAEEDRNRHLENAKILNQECLPLKKTIDDLRSDIGLNPLPDLYEDDDKITPEFFEKTPKLTETSSWHTIVHQATPSSEGPPAPGDTRSRPATGGNEKPSSLPDHPLPHHHEPGSPLTPMNHQSSSASSLMAAANASAAAASAAQMHHHFVHAAAVQRAVGAPGHSNKPPGATNAFSLHGMGANQPSGSLMDRPSSLVGSSSIRQQPPPMKSCQSCHQQIHRNAPICPLCKAKSRSRNPKKPKRRVED